MADRSIATLELLAWYDRSRRDLPWRRTRRPYPVWVSEIMLQQTRVAAVVPYYERFLERFPDVDALARAKIDTVLSHWSGLGYYRRARMLHAAAKVVAREGFPCNAKELRRLSGIGAYTAAAIASICFDEPIAVVDGNVERVLCRLHARDLPKRRIQELAAGRIAPGRPGDSNQAMMELGATICTPRSPRCPECPLRVGCMGRNSPERYPSPKPRKAPVVEEHFVGLVLRDKKVLLRRRGKNERLLSGMWELPPARGHGEPLAVIRHGIVHKQLVYRVYVGSARKGRWFAPAQLARLALTTAARKCLVATGILAQ